MKNKTITYSAAILLAVLFSQRIQAQEKDLLELVGEDKPQKEIVKNAFKSIRVINGHSMEFLFQLHVSNAAGMNERAFITETTASWGKVDIRFGFNLSRVFQLWKVKR